MSLLHNRLRTTPQMRKLRSILKNLRNIRSSPQLSIVANVLDLSQLTVFDVGANIGQFGIDLRSHGFRGRIISFEPVSQTFKNLIRTTSRFQPWETLQLGLGAVEGESQIQISGNNALSSSILTVNEIHLKHFPKSLTVGSETIQISTIDNQISALGIEPSNIFLKLDVQGYEYEVLKGARNSLPLIPFCFLEISLIPLYEGEHAMLQILNTLEESGHRVIDVHRGTETTEGELLQLDILTKLFRG